MTQYSILQEKDILAISKKYALNLINYESIEDGAGNTNYLVKTIQNQYILTIFEIEHIRVANISRLLSLLEKIDFPTTRIQKLANGDTVTSFQGKPVLRIL